MKLQLAFDPRLDQQGRDLLRHTLKFAAWNIGSQMDYATLTAIVDDPIFETLYVDEELHAEWTTQWLLQTQGRHYHGVITDSVRRYLDRSGLEPDEVLVCVTSFDTPLAEEAISLGCLVIDITRSDVKHIVEIKRNFEQVLA